MRTLRLLSICLVLSLSAVSAMAQVPDSFFDVFYVELGGDVGQWNVLTAGGGSGYPPTAPGEWFWYPGTGPQYDGWGNPNLAPSWWNEWFYDGNFRPGYKVVDLGFMYSLVNPNMPGGANIVINWTTPEWSLDPANAGKVPTSNDFIGRAEVGRVWLEAGRIAEVFQDSFNLSLLPGGPHFNPEWVSIDVSGYNVSISNGTFHHTCVPEPGTLALLISGGLGLLLFAWRRRR
jgi:hypothetical protein